MNLILCLTLIFNILYGGLLFGYYLKLRNYKSSVFSEVDINSNWPTITIIVPFRNEEKNLPSLLNSLSTLDFPSSKLEIIFVDDHSEDDSLQLLKSQKYFSLTDTFGKKAALDFGIQQSNSDWIVTIDADVKFKSDWLKQLIHSSINSNVNMICGIVQIEYDKNKWWSKFQAMEFANLQASGTAALMQNHPLLNSGANLAFKREIWVKVEGYNSHQHLASGDDTFLMFAINKSFPRTVVPAIESIVTTLPEENLSSLIKQRLRWSGKTIHYKDRYVWFVGILVTTSAILTTFCWIVSFYLLQHTFYFAVLFYAIRAIPEWMLLDKYLNGRENKFTFLDKLIMSFIYPFFVLILILMQPSSKNSWKGRKL